MIHPWRQSIANGTIPFNCIVVGNYYHDLGPTGDWFRQHGLRRPLPLPLPPGSYTAIRQGVPMTLLVFGPGNWLWIPLELAA